MNRLFRLFLALLLALALTSCCAAAETRALFINVGKADAALIEVNGLRYLVDTGHKDSFDQLWRVLKAYSITHIDGVFVTHTDKDHAGGLKKLLKNGLKVNQLYASALHSEKAPEDHPAYEAAEKYGVPLTWLHAGDAVAAGEGAQFYVLGPLRQDPENENNNSLVMLLSTADGSIFLTGDMERSEEEDLFNAGLIPQADVYKVPHHGREDVFAKQLAIAVQPQWAIISTNTAQQPDSPDEKLLTRLSQVRANVAVTQDAEVGILLILRNGSIDAQRIDWQ